MLTQTSRPAPFQHPAAGFRHAPPAGREPVADSPDLVGALMPFARNSEIYGENEPADYLYKVERTVHPRVLVDGRRAVGFICRETCSVSRAESTRFRRKPITDR
jgi:CRP/FNR family nitrogen fixation transcriptional regulator